MFRAHVFIIRRSKLHYTASGIITLKQVSELWLYVFFLNLKDFRDNYTKGEITPDDSLSVHYKLCLFNNTFPTTYTAFEPKNW